MTEIKLTIQSEDPRDVEHIQEIFKALIQSGGLTGVRGGQTILHFDSIGNFQGVQLSYWPYRVRTKK